MCMLVWVSRFVVQGVRLAPVLCVHIHPFSSTETEPKTKSSLGEVLFFLPPETANQSEAVCKQFQKPTQAV